MPDNQNNFKNKLFEEHPYFAISYEPQFSSEDLENIGIKMPGISDLPEGYIKLYPEDFIVEEVRSDKKICTIDPEPSWEVELGEKARFIHATIVKKGLPTLEANIRVAKALGIFNNRISHSGLKDAVAITAQLISIDNVELEQLQAVKLANITLKDFEYKRFFNKIGNLYGNRFTILVRTKGAVDTKALQKQIDVMVKDGIPNFFSTQRFGRRLRSHMIGKKILQRDFEGAMRELFSKTSPYEIPFVSMVRVQVQDNWRDWNAIEALFRKMPGYFINELQFLQCLKERPNDFAYPLNRYPNLSKLFCYAYMSYVYNKTISKFLTEGREVPRYFSYMAGQKETLPEYLSILKEEGVDLTKLNVPELPFLMLPKNKASLIIYPEQVSLKSVDEGVVLGFILPKGAYATNFLSFLFNLREGDPKPEWAGQTIYETKPILGERENILKNTKNEDSGEE